MIPLLKNYTLVVFNLVGELWMGCFRRNSDFYDQHSVTKTKAGYVIFVASVSLVTIAIVSWSLLRINK
ncbi:hypothetical protein D3C81_1864440 [compost metagenome]